MGLFVLLQATPAVPVVPYTHAVAPLGGTVFELTTSGVPTELTTTLTGNYTNDGTLV